MTPKVQCGYEDDPFELVQSGPKLDVKIGYDADYRKTHVIPAEAGI